MELVELFESAVEREQLGAPSLNERLVEAVLLEHLEDEAPEVAELVLARLDERTAFPAYRAGRRQDGARRTSGPEGH